MTMFNRVWSFKFLTKLVLLTSIVLLAYKYARNFTCFPLDLTEFIQSSINKPLPPEEKVSLNLIPDLKNPCWYETFDENDVLAMRSNPYVQVSKYKILITAKRKAIMNGYADRYSSMLRENQRTRLRCIPYFYIIGQPKCASSDLYYTLGLHPNIWSGLLKESQWWAWTRIGKLISNGSISEIVPLELSDLADLFSNVSMTWQRQLKGTCKNRVDSCEQPIISDGSVYTLKLAYEFEETGTRRGRVLEEPITAPNYLKWLVPQAKLILIAREPGDRLYSAYKYFRLRNKKRNMKNSKNITISAANFHKEVVNYVRLFKKCVKTTPAHLCPNKPSLRRNQDMLLADGLYSIYLQEWIRVVGRDNILVIRTEDYGSHRMETLEKIFRFLGVCDPPEDVKVKLANATQNNQGRIDVGPMLPKTRRILDNFFEPYNRQLAELLNDPKFLWKDQQRPTKN